MTDLRMFRALLDESSEILEIMTSGPVSRAVAHGRKVADALEEFAALVRKFVALGHNEGGDIEELQDKARELLKKHDVR